MVTRYQLHKCSQYCKRSRKCGNTYITRCRFGFPRQPCETAKLNPVSDSLKSRSKIYQLTRSESETRVNDYNPLLLLLWKANIDIQFVAESLLALAHYVSGYVTKAEKSSMQNFGNILVITKVYMVTSGALVCVACASEYVVCMKPVIYCLVITSPKNPPL